jgi:hypothetical protein
MEVVTFPQKSAFNGLKEAVLLKGRRKPSVEGFTLKRRATAQGAQRVGDYTTVWGKLSWILGS